MADECVLMSDICRDVTPCYPIYYHYSKFIYEQRMWSYPHWYNPFLMMIYTQDPYLSFALAVFWEILEEMSLALTVWTGYNMKLKNEWDHADTMFDMLSAAYGVAIGILIIWITKAPRLIRYPYRDIASFHSEYGCPDVTPATILAYKKETFVFLRNKYWIQIFFMNFVPSRAFLLITPNADGEVPIVGFFRTDWVIYTSTQMLIILIVFAMNWRSEAETKFIWKNNYEHYKFFHFIWFVVFLLFTAPSFYMWTYPKVQVMIALNLIVVILVPISIFLRCKPIDLRFLNVRQYMKIK